MKTKLFFFALMSLFIFATCNKKEEPKPNADDKPKNVPTIPINKNETVYIILNTTKAADGEIALKIFASEEDKEGLWIDLNGNGTKEEGEGIILEKDFSNYTISSSCIAIYGKIIDFSCMHDSIDYLDVSKNPYLKKLDCSQNIIKELQISNNPVLEELSCGYNQIETLNTDDAPALKYLFCNKNLLTSLNLSKNKELTALSCASNDISNLNLSENASLKMLECSENKLSVLDLNAKANLKKLHCSKNNLTKLELSKIDSLNHLSCGNNQLTELIINKNARLKWFHCNDNKFSELKFNADSLIALVIYNNQIEKEKMQNLVTALPTRAVNDAGFFFVFDKTNPNEKNVITKEQVSTLVEVKGWTVKDSEGELYGGQ